MKETILAKRYANAFCSSFENKEGIDSIELLKSISVSFSQHDLLWKFFNSPIISLEKKQNLLNKLLSSFNTNKTTVTFLTYLIKKKRFYLLKYFDQLLTEKLDELKNTSAVIISSSVQFNTKTKEELLAFIEKIEQKKLIPHFELDDEIISGFKIQVGNKMYDATLNNALKQFKNKISAY